MDPHFDPDFDSLAACGAATLAMAIRYAKMVENDVGLAHWVRELESLPDWKTDPAKWTLLLQRTRKKYRRPSKGTLKKRTLAMQLFGRVCSSVETVTDDRWTFLSRNRALVFAASAMGALARMVGGEREIETAVTAGVAGSISDRARKAVALRKVNAKAAEMKAIWDKWKAGQRVFATNTAFAATACKEIGLTGVQHWARRAGVWERERLAALKGNGATLRN